MSNHNQTNAVQLVTRRELADRWQLSVETLKRRERCGILPFLKLGRGVRYRLVDVEHIEAEAESGAPYNPQSHKLRLGLRNPTQRWEANNDAVASSQSALRQLWRTRVSNRPVEKEPL